ncbi:MAG: metalloprotease PmbA [Silanimonas sp.]
MNDAQDNAVTADATLDRLAELSALAVSEARRLGASQAEASANDERGLNVNVRMGEVESVERTRDRGIAVTVYFGQRKAQASTADLQLESLRRTVEMACAIAKHTEPDPANGLADEARMARAPRDFDQWHPWAIEADAAVALALEAEAAGRGFDPRISNSEGASVSTNEGLSVYANSHGFVGREKSTSHSISASLIAGSGDAMQGQYWYSAALHAEALESAAHVGRKAAERTLARLDPRSAPTGEFPVLFVPEAARSLVAHLVGAVSGGALYRKASFLVNAQGQQLFPDWFRIVERPHLLGGWRSGDFDADGVATRESALVDGGVLQRYVLGTYSARRLGLESTGNAGGVHNLEVAANAEGFDSMLKGMTRGLVVTELMGQGVNTVTGDYSRGAAGFWVEGGAVAYPVDELTIASNLREMFMAIEAVGADIDTRSATAVGSLLVGRMTVAGGEAAEG